MTCIFSDVTTYLREEKTGKKNVLLNMMGHHWRLEYMIYDLEYKALELTYC